MINEKYLFKKAKWFFAGFKIMFKENWPEVVTILSYTGIIGAMIIFKMFEI